MSDPSNRTVEQENELSRERTLQRMRERHRAFIEVFGAPDAPTKHGAAILDALYATFGRGLPKNVLDAHDRTDLWQTARRLGHFDVIELINDAIRWKESEHVNPGSSSSR